MINRKKYLRRSRLRSAF